jgi:hypothetical protein
MSNSSGEHDPGAEAVHPLVGEYDLDVDAIAVLIRDPLRDRGQVKRVKTGRETSLERVRRQPNNDTITPWCDP